MTCTLICVGICCWKTYQNLNWQDINSWHRFHSFLPDCLQNRFFTYVVPPRCTAASWCRTGRCGLRRRSSVCAVQPPGRCKGSGGLRFSPWWQWCRTLLCSSPCGRSQRMWTHLEPKVNQMHWENMCTQRIFNYQTSLWSVGAHYCLFFFFSQLSETSTYEGYTLLKTADREGTSN